MLVATLWVEVSQGAKIRIRGRATVEARVVPAALGIEVRGRLADDAGAPIGGAVVYIAVDGATLPRVQACGPSPAEHHRGGRDEVGVGTSADGSFCLLILSPTLAGQLKLRSPATKDFEEARALVPIDPKTRGLRLEFQPKPRALPLDRKTHDVVVKTRLEPPLDREARPPPIALELLDERKTMLDRQRIEAGGEAGFMFPASKLGPPGAGKLTVRFAGSPEISRAETSIVVQRTVRVTMQLARPVQAGDPRDGLDVHVAVGSALGAVPGGSVEAVVGSESVGTAPVVRGAAHLVAVFDAPQRGNVPLTLRYLPDSPWWVAAEPLRITAPVSGPSAWRRLPWLLVALAIGAWVVSAWRRPKWAEREKPEGERSRPTGRASVELIEAGPAESGWRGAVIDAHEGEPVPDARVQIVVPAFEGDGVARWARTDDRGEFELEHVAGATQAEGARIEVRAPWHTTLQKPVPRPGYVSIAVVSRRRALLDRLVRWAARRGRPWAQRGDATPGHVARVARRRSAKGVDRWARAVEEAAYGPAPLDEGQDHAVRRLEPERAQEDDQGR